MPAPLPDRFIEHLRPLLGNAEDEQAFRAACARPLPTCIRSNPHQLENQDLADLLASMGLECTASTFFAGAFRIKGKTNFGKSVEQALGLGYLQEEASLLPVAASAKCLAARPMMALDLCASPGSKTTQLAGILKPGSLIVANEPSSARLKTLVANMLRSGTREFMITQQDGRDLGRLFPQAFDLVLVDAPCSGEGTLRKDPKALRGWHPKRKKSLVKIQRELLESAWAASAPGALVAYSTCALSPLENHDICRDFMLGHNDLKVVDLGGILPHLGPSLTKEGFCWLAPHHHDTGGFFLALFSKKGSLRPYEQPAFTNPMPQDLGLLLEDFGVDPTSLSGPIEVRNEDYLLLPAAASLLPAKAPWNRRGIRLAKKTANNLELDHEWLLTQGHHATRRIIEIDRSQARRYFSGLDLKINASPEEGLHMLQFEGQALGFAKASGCHLANKLPRAYLRNNLV